MKGLESYYTSTYFICLNMQMRFLTLCLIKDLDGFKRIQSKNLGIRHTPPRLCTVIKTRAIYITT